MDAAGDFVVTWNTNNYAIYAQRYDASGVAVGGAVLVNASLVGYINRGGTVSMDSVGDFVVAWQSSSDTDNSFSIHAQRFNPQGVPQGNEFRVNTYTTGDQQNAAIAMDAAGDF